MDTDLLAMSGASAGTITIVLLIYKILKSVMGKKLISNCCGRKLELGLDIQPSTPQNIAPSVDAKDNPYYQSRPGGKSEGRSRRASRENTVTIQDERATREERTGRTSPDNERTHPISITLPEHV